LGTHSAWQTKSLLKDGLESKTRLRVLWPNTVREGGCTSQRRHSSALMWTPMASPSHWWPWRPRKPFFWGEGRCPPFRTVNSYHTSCNLVAFLYLNLWQDTWDREVQTDWFRFPQPIVVNSLRINEIIKQRLVKSLCLPRYTVRLNRSKQQSHSLVYMGHWIGNDQIGTKIVTEKWKYPWHMQGKQSREPHRTPGLLREARRLAWKELPEWVEQRSSI
jgi:hypothetical protein